MAVAEWDGVSKETPRPLQLLHSAIRVVTTKRELKKLRDMARDEWGDHARYPDIEAQFERRVAELEGRGGTQLALPLDV